MSNLLLFLPAFQIFRHAESQAVIWTQLSAFGMDINFAAASRAHNSIHHLQFTQRQNIIQNQHHLLFLWKHTVGKSLKNESTERLARCSQVSTKAKLFCITTEKPYMHFSKAALAALKFRQERKHFTVWKRHTNV